MLVLFKAVARIGANLCCLYNEPEEQSKFLSIITDAEWGVKLSKLDVKQFLSFIIFISVLCLFWCFTLIWVCVISCPMFYPCLRYPFSLCFVSNLK